MNADVQRLEAERLRPSPPDPSLRDLLGELIAALAALYRTPPDTRGNQ